MYVCTSRKSATVALILTLGIDGRIAPRSGLASKHFIDTGAGVIDADYRGQVKVLLFNHAETEYKVVVGDRIAQLVLERVSRAFQRGCEGMFGRFGMG